MKKKYVFYILLSFLFLNLGMIKVSAAEMNFSVQAIIPENQIDKSQSYFDLRMKSGQAQDLIVNMSNDSTETVSINISTNSAITNQNGIVEYNNTTVSRDSSLKIAFSDIASSVKEMTIPAHSQKQVKIHIKMPNNEYNGTVLGGIYFTEKAKESENDEKGSQIVNRYAYVIGVSLTENDNPVSPNLQLTSVQAKQVNYRNIIAGNIQNTNAALIKDLSIEGKVYKKGSSKVLYSSKRDNLRMAPNSNFDFGISLNNQPFKPGKYTFKGVANAGEQKWKFEKDFEIKGPESKNYNQKAVSLKKDYTWLYIFSALIIVAILFIIIIILIRKIHIIKNNINKKK